MTRRTARQEQPVLELVDAMAEDGVTASGDPTVGDSLPPDTFESFYYREFPRLLALARALAGPSQAADIAQDAMVVAYQRWDSVRSYDSPVGWVRGVCSHKAFSFVRRSMAEDRALSRLRRRPQLSVDNSLADDEFWREVRRLPRRQAQVVALYYALDLSVADVAATLDCAEGTVKAHLSRARESLQKRLEPETEIRS